MKLEKGQVALVTGGSRGLGAEIAITLAQSGLDLILTSRDVEALESVAKNIRNVTGKTVATIAADMAKPADISNLAQEITDRFGGVDVLVNNAGVESTLRFDQRSLDEIQQMIAVNLTGPMLLTHALVPSMLARGKGHIVNIASVAGMMAVPFNEPYCATKFGLVGFTKSFRMTAQACNWGVSASVICPGFIEGAGLFEDLKREYDVLPDGLGTAPLADIGPAIIRAIEEDLSDVFVTDGDPREVVALSITNPEIVEAGALGSAVTSMFRTVASARNSS